MQVCLFCSQTHRQRRCVHGNTQIVVDEHHTSSSSRGGSRATHTHKHTTRVSTSGLRPVHPLLGPLCDCVGLDWTELGRALLALATTRRAASNHCYLLQIICTTYTTKYLKSVSYHMPSQEDDPLVGNKRYGSVMSTPNINQLGEDVGDAKFNRSSSVGPGMTASNLNPQQRNRRALYVNLPFFRSV